MKFAYNLNELSQYDAMKKIVLPNRYLNIQNGIKLTLHIQKYKSFLAFRCFVGIKISKLIYLYLKSYTTFNDCKYVVFCIIFFNYQNSYRKLVFKMIQNKFSPFHSIVYQKYVSDVVIEGILTYFNCSINSENTFLNQFSTTQ